MLRSLRPALLFAALLVTPLSLVAQSPTEIFARYTRAVDPQGRAASIQGMKLTMKMEIPAAGMTADIVALQARPNLMVLNIEIPGLGQMRQGYDGTTAWAADPMGGPRLMTGAEATAFIDEADMKSLVRTMDLFANVESAGETEVNGDKATCLKLTWKSGRVTTECYSNSTGLITETRTKQESPQGEVDALAHPSDYRMAGGFLLAHRVVQSAMGMQQIMTLVTIEYAPQATTLFELPPEIKALKP